MTFPDSLETSICGPGEQGWTNGDCRDTTSFVEGGSVPRTEDAGSDGGRGGWGGLQRPDLKTGTDLSVEGTGSEVEGQLPAGFGQKSVDLGSSPGRIPQATASRQNSGGSPSAGVSTPSVRTLSRPGPTPSPVWTLVRFHGEVLLGAQNGRSPSDRKIAGRRVDPNETRQWRFRS